MFAGSAQFVMVEMWKAPIPVLQIALAVIAVNPHYVLIGASLRPVFSGHPWWRKALLMHLVADEKWAVTFAEHRSNGTDPYFLFGFELIFQVGDPWDYPWPISEDDLLPTEAVHLKFKNGPIASACYPSRVVSVRRPCAHWYRGVQGAVQAVSSNAAK
ncbi:MAG: AzlC family ABC transporter permease [Desulfobacterales bacterium]